MKKRNKILTLLVSSALILAAVFGVFTVRSAYAQAATPTPAAPTTQTAPVQPGLGKPGRGGPGVNYTDADLAAALGITTEQLQAAYQSANTEALKEAVSQGLMTQAQADQLAASGRGYDARRFGGANGIDYNAILAKALGITSEQLQAGYQKAYDTSLDTALKNGTLTQAQVDLMKGRSALANNAKFKASMQSAYEAAVKQAVTDGVITQAQADAILQQQSQAGDSGFGFGGRGFGHGPDGFGHPGFNPNGQNGSNNPATPNPTTAPSTNGL